MEAFERGNVVVREVSRSTPTGRVRIEKIVAREREFERRYRGAGKDMTWKSCSAGPRPETSSRVIYRRRAHPEIFAASDAMERVRKQRRVLIQSCLGRFRDR